MTSRRPVVTLEDMPERCPLAPEAKFLEQDVRHLLLGGYRILFLIDVQHVRVITVRHASREPPRRPPPR